LQEPHEDGGRRKTDEERFAQMRRINNRLLDEIERSQNQPRWTLYAMFFGAVVAGFGLMAVVVTVAKHFL
jgi:hypothetical protein